MSCVDVTFPETWECHVDQAVKTHQECLCAKQLIAASLHYPFHLRAAQTCKDVRGRHLGIVTALLAPAFSHQL